MFLRDDPLDDATYFRHPERLATLDTRFLETPRGAKPSKDDAPLSVALASLRERLLPKVPAALWMRRFVRSVKEHFESTLWESINRAQRVVPDLSTYNRMRLITGGMDVNTNSIEISTGVYLPPEVHGHHGVSSLTRISNLSVCWTIRLGVEDEDEREPRLVHKVGAIQKASGRGYYHCGLLRMSLSAASPARGFEKKNPCP